MVRGGEGEGKGWSQYLQRQLWFQVERKGGKETGREAGREGEGKSSSGSIAVTGSGSASDAQ